MERDLVLVVIVGTLWAALLLAGIWRLGCPRRREIELRAALSFAALRTEYMEASLFATAFIEDHPLLEARFPAWPAYRTDFVRRYQETVE